MELIIFLVIILVIIFYKCFSNYTLENFFNFGFKSKKINLVDGVYAIKSIKSKKWCSGHPWGVICDKKNIGDWERFIVKKMSGNNYAIVSSKTNKVCRIHYINRDQEGSFIVKCDGFDNRRQNFDSRDIFFSDEKFKIGSNMLGHNLLKTKKYDLDCKYAKFSRYSKNPKIVCNTPNKKNKSIIPSQNNSFVFVLLERLNEKNTFCPDPDYLEYNPSACFKPDDVDSCMRTPKPGNKPSISQCKTKLKDYVGENNFELFDLIWEAYEYTKINKKNDQKKNLKYLPNGDEIIFESVSSKKYLDVAGNSKRRGAVLNQFKNTGQDNQKWTYNTKDKRIKSVHSGLCIDVNRASKRNGTKIQQWNCSNVKNQKWKYNPRTKQLKSLHSGKCLVVSGKSKRDRAKIHLWRCNNSKFQKWNVKSADGINLKDRINKKKEYKGTELIFKAHHSNRCLDVAGRSKKNGAGVVQWDCNKKKKNQRWLYDKTNKTLKSVNSGKCLEVSGGSKKIGAKIQQWRCNGGSNQKWDYNPKTKTLKNVNSDKCADIYRSSKKNGAKLIQWYCNRGKNQKFEVGFAKTKPIPLSYINNARNLRQYKRIVLPFSSRFLNKIMVEIYKLGCIIKDTTMDNFNVDRCKRSINPRNINKSQWFSVVQDVSMDCKNSNSVQSNACKQFKSHLNILMTMAKKIAYSNNEVTNSCLNYKDPISKMVSRNAPC